MTKQTLQNAIRFLRRLYVGPSEFDVLERTIQALEKELTKKERSK
jgi:hypothetical protein